MEREWRGRGMEMLSLHLDKHACEIVVYVQQKAEGQKREIVKTYVFVNVGGGLPRC